MCGARLATGSEAERRALNDLARHQLVSKVLADVLLDMRVCLLEGWDPRGLPRMLVRELSRWA